MLQGTDTETVTVRTTFTLYSRAMHSLDIEVELSIYFIKVLAPSIDSSKDAWSVRIGPED